MGRQNGNTYNLAAAKRAIFAECRALGLDEATRRGLVQSLGRVPSGSMRGLDEEGARRVLDHLRRSSGQASTAAARRSGSRNPWAFIDQAAAELQPLLRKICVLCRSMGVDKAYAEGVARRQHHIERHLEMMDAGELWKVAAALVRTRDFRDRAAPPPEGGVCQPGERSKG